MPPKGKSSSIYLYLISFVAALGGFLFGYDTGIISGALTFLQQSFPMSTITLELVVSSVVLGALVGALISGRTADYFGRRSMLICAASAFLSGTLVISLASSITSLIVGRFIVGIAIGLSSYITPLFISEIAPSHKRGSLVLLNAITITGGEAIAFLVDYALTPTGSWRWMFATGLIPALLLFIGMLFLPSTPRWSASKGFTQKAKQTLQKIRPGQNVDKELNEIIATLNRASGKWQNIFSKKLYPVLLLGISLGVLQQFVGINTVMYYGPVIFKTAGFQSASAQILATFGMGIVNTIMSVIGVFIVDKIGRRKLLLSGLFAAGISLLFIGNLFLTPQLSSVQQYAMILLMIIYISGYCISIGSLFWLIISEIYPLHIRGIAMSVVTATQWGANFIVATTFLSILNYFGPQDTFWLYACICLIGMLLVYKWVPETSGASLEQIESNIHAGFALRDIGTNNINNPTPILKPLPLN